MDCKIFKMIQNNVGMVELTVAVHFQPRGPTHIYFHILMTGMRGGGPSDFLGSEILAKSDFLGVYEDTVIFLGLDKKQWDIFGL